jgi:hypothetical protein
MLNMLDTFNAYSDINNAPRSAGAVGFLWGTSVGFNSKTADVGISWQTIRVALEN